MTWHAINRATYAVVAGAGRRAHASARRARRIVNASPPRGVQAGGAELERLAKEREAAARKAQAAADKQKAADEKIFAGMRQFGDGAGEARRGHGRNTSGHPGVVTAHRQAVEFIGR